MNNHQSIGILDSGFGGLTVMRAIRHVLPYENLLYFGDTARLPYGNKSSATIVRYCTEIASLLVDEGIKALVIACHTACSCLAVEDVQRLLSIPVMGVLIPGVEQAVRASKNGHISILGTRQTIASGVHKKEILARRSSAELYPLACPLFVPLVEEGWIDHFITGLTIREYLRPLEGAPVDTILLACTHYPLLEPILRKEKNIQLIDPGLACAGALYDTLASQNMLRTQQATPKNRFIVSDDPEKFRYFGTRFLDDPFEDVTCKPL